MKVSGISFIRNAIKYDYPIIEAITSILPVCDEFVVAIGNSEDETEELIKSIHSDKIRIIHTVWDDSLREGGKVLAEETNKAFDAVAPDSDWVFYIQGDEVVHEDYLDEIKKSMEQCLDRKEIQGLVFHYRHFYGSYDYIGDSRAWYRREVRIIRNNKNIRSYRDAQGFRINEKPITAKLIPAWVNHYGWVKPPEVQQAKQQTFNKLWHSDHWVKDNVADVEQFDYTEIDSLKRFTGSHPAVMIPRIEKMNWHFTFDPTKKKMSTRKRILHWIENLTGYRIGEFKNYSLKQ